MQPAALTYRTITQDGRPFALWSDGTLLPIVSGGQDDPPKDPPADPPKPDDPPADPPKDDKVVLTAEQQAHVDKLIDAAHGKGKAKGAAERESAIKAYLEQQGLGDADRLKAERDAAAKERDDAKAEVLHAKVESAAERAALAAGVKPDRVERFMRLVDLKNDDLTTDGKPDADAIKALIDKELAAVPEFKGGASTSGASGTDNLNGGGGGKVWTREEVDKLSLEEFEKHEAEIMKQLQGAGVK